MDARDLEVLYDTWASRLLAYMMTLIGDRSRAEDALQNLFVKLARGKSDLRNPAVYLFRAARNEAFRVSRRRREGTLENLDVLSGRDDRFLAIDLAEAVGRLPAEQQEVVLLHVFAGLSFRETAEIVGVPLDTAASRFRYALDRLREILEP